MSKPMTFDNYLAREMQNPEFKAEWDALEPEFRNIRNTIEGHEMNDLAQEQLCATADEHFKPGHT